MNDIMLFGNRCNGGNELNMKVRRYQQPTPKLRGGYWQIIIREDLQNEAGNVRRVQRRVTLGDKNEIPTQLMASRLAKALLSKVNGCGPKIVMTFSELVERWQDTVLVEQKASSQSSTRSLLRSHLLPEFGDAYLHNITTESIQSFIARSRHKLNAKTVWNCVMVFRAIWKTAIRWGKVEGNPCEGVELRTPQMSEGRYFTAEEVRAILRASTEPMRTFYWVAGETGARGGELCALRWKDIDLERCIATIQRSVWRGEFTDTKSGRIRRLAISEQLSRRLSDMSRENGQHELIFHTRNATPWNGNMLVSRKLRPLLEKLGIAPAGLHAFRHFSASEGARMFGANATLRGRLGHSTLAVTDRYAHGVSSDDRAIAERIAESIAPQKPQSSEFSVAEM